MPSPDLSEFKDLNGRSGNAGRCGAAIFIATLSDTEREQLEGAFADPTIQAAAIHRWLAKRGYTLKEESVRKHRRRGCACGDS